MNESVDRRPTEKLALRGGVDCCAEKPHAIISAATAIDLRIAELEKVAERLKFDLRIVLRPVEGEDTRRPVANKPVANKPVVSPLVNVMQELEARAARVVADINSTISRLEL